MYDAIFIVHALDQSPKDISKLRTTFKGGGVM